MSGHGEKFERKSDEAVAALLSSPTIEAAAGKVGVSPATLRRWLGDSDFRNQYRAARRAVVEGAVGRLQAAVGKAVEALEAAMAGGRDSDKIRAALGVIGFALRGVELLDMNERVEAIEAAMKSRETR